MKAITQYNNLMMDLRREHNTIGTIYSEHTENWNLRDMVSEVQYTLDLWNNEEFIYWQDAHDKSQPDHKPWLKGWQSEKARMQRFIDKYKAEALTLECAIDHCSEYD